MKTFPEFTQAHIIGNSAPIARSSAVKFVQDSSLFSFSLLIAGLCNMLRTFFVANLLGPEGFGIWRFINIFAEYLHFASLGTQPALHRWIPYLRGRGDAETLDLMIRTASTINFYCAIVYSAGVFVWSFFLSEPSSAHALTAFAPVILLLVWLNYSLGFSLDIGLQGLRSWLEIVHALLTLALSLFLISFFGLYGAIYGLGISALVTIVISYKRLRKYCSFTTIDWSILRLLIVTGFPIMAEIVLPITMSNIDRILIAVFLTPESLGIYSIGNAGVTILGMIPSALGQMLFVKFAEMQGENRTKEHMGEIIEKTTAVLSSLFAPVLAFAIVLFPVIVVLLLPAYAEGITAGRLLIASLFFVAAAVPATKWCVSSGYSVYIILARLVAITAEFLLMYYVVSTGGGLELIAFCMLLSVAFFAFATNLICYTILDKPILSGCIRTCKGVLPFVSITAVILVQDFFFQPVEHSFDFQLLASSATALAVGCVVSAPFLSQVNKYLRLSDLFLLSAR